ncbi:prepilin peptidase [Brachybacterium alimentarium]|uniref:prepilin peptidase n=1 Tax=Brachybacterium alimentarium TaxID=47845 RepID=UPI003FCF9575
MYLSTPQLWPALALFLLLALPMVVTDARESRLPLPLNLGLLGAGAVALSITAAWVGFEHLIWAAVSCGIATALMLILFVVSRGGLGFGDVILVAALALYSGFISPLMMFAGTWLGSVATLGWILVRRRRGFHGHAPFGPGLILATLLVLVAPVATT